MKMVQKMLFIPMIIAALTVFGMEATALSERNPSPVRHSWSITWSADWLRPL